VTQHPWLDLVRFTSDGLVPVIAQAAGNGDLLMLGWADREALQLTATSGQAHYWSRSRKALWRKGETSGHTQRVREIRLDCDGDTVLYRVDQEGPACHTGQPTCFSTVVLPDGETRASADPGGHLLTRLASLVASRATERPEGSYTARLLDAGAAKVAQKVGEEAVEVVVAATAESDERLASEAADLLYHLIVLLQTRGLSLGRVLTELEQRER
jgi:phosphoribosyl-AMP cyclohydrolase / phosphoribosyl-ATP pyrophosphohydrolase